MSTIDLYTAMVVTAMFVAGIGLGLLHILAKRQQRVRRRFRSNQMNQKIRAA